MGLSQIHPSVFVNCLCSAQDRRALPHLQFQLVHIGLNRKWVGDMGRTTFAVSYRLSNQSAIAVATVGADPQCAS